MGPITFVARHGRRKTHNPEQMASSAAAMHQMRDNDEASKNIVIELYDAGGQTAMPVRTHGRIAVQAGPQHRHSIGEHERGSS